MVVVLLLVMKNKGKYMSAPLNTSLTSVPASISSVILLNTNMKRLGCVIHNNGSSTLRLGFSDTVSINLYSIKLEADEHYEFFLASYLGPISGIWEQANGTAQITEIIDVAS